MSRHKITKRKLPGSGAVEEGGGASRAEGVSARHSSRRGQQSASWSGKHVFLGVLLGVGLGLVIGYSLGGVADSGSTSSSVASGTVTPQAVAPGSVAPGSVAPGTAPAPTTPSFQPTSGPQGVLDAYGRPPSDPHYGHNHP